jgi:hypothetical protein
VSVVADIVFGGSSSHLQAQQSHGTLEGWGAPPGGGQQRGSRGDDAVDDVEQSRGSNGASSSAHGNSLRRGADAWSGGSVALIPPASNAEPAVVRAPQAVPAADDLPLDGQLALEDLQVDGGEYCHIKLGFTCDGTNGHGESRHEVCWQPLTTSMTAAQYNGRSPGRAQTCLSGAGGVGAWCRMYVFL